MDTTEKEEFERQISGDTDEYRGEYKILQTAPSYSPYDATVLIKPGAEKAAANAWQSFTEPVQDFVRLMDSEDRFRIYQVRDRCYAGYANIYRGIRDLAPHLEDARFFIAEGDSRWVDEYELCDGNLAFRRNHAPPPDGDYGLEGRAWLMAYLLQRARSEAGDVRVAMARHYADVAQEQLDAMHNTDDHAHRDKAQLALDESVSLHQSLPFSYLQRGRLHRVRGEGLAAVECFEQARKSSDPEIAREAVKYLVAIALSNEDRDEAISLTEQLEQVGDHEARLLLAAAHHGLDPERGISYVSQIVDNRASWRQSRSALLTRPLSRNRFKQLMKLLSKVERPDEDKAELLHRIASGLAGHVSRAPEVYLKLVDSLFETSLKYNRDNASVWYERGVLQMKNARRTEGREVALSYFREAVKIEEHRESLQELAEHEYSEKRYLRAQGFYHRYLSVSARAPVKGYGFNVYLWHALFSYAHCMLENIDQLDGDEFRQARAYALFALETFVPWFESVDNALVLVGDLLAFQNRFEEAKTLYELALANDPRCVQALSHKAGVCSSQKKYDETTTLLDAAEQLDPGYWHLHFVRACIAVSQDNIEEALAHLKKSLATIPENCKAILQQEKELADLRWDPRYQDLLPDS